MRNLSIYSLIFALFVTLAACGNGEEAPAQTEETVADDVRTIEIIGIDDMRFVVAGEQEGLVVGEQSGQEYILEQIIASPGEELRIILHTRSDLPGTAMSHNLAILELGTDVDAFVNASMIAADNEYIAPDMEGQVMITTEMLAGGESDTIQFTVPDETGIYDYVCTFPGHFATGMYGELVVE